MTEGIQSYGTDIADNRVIIKVNKENELGPEIYEKLEEKVDELIQLYGNEATQK